eukprot:GAHX01001439.1.p1 GENE.GAHX01001439.1~~GAHX01001439.1.p1  ORF type:complete len:298 (-),score=30.67 GAHX01001439.1:28-921(-)
MINLYFLALAFIIRPSLEIPISTRGVVVFTYLDEVLKSSPSVFAFLQITYINLEDPEDFYNIDPGLMLTHIMSFTFKLRTSQYYTNCRYLHSSSKYIYEPSFTKGSSVETIQALFDDIKNRPGDVIPMLNRTTKIGRNISIEAKNTATNPNISHFAITKDSDWLDINHKFSLYKAYSFYFDHDAMKNVYKIMVTKFDNGYHYHTDDNVLVDVLNLENDDLGKMDPNSMQKKDIFNYFRDLWNKNYSDVFKAGIKPIKYTPDSPKKRFYVTEILIIVGLSLAMVGIVCIFIYGKFNGK